jgi:hypothetical protein
MGLKPTPRSSRLQNTQRYNPEDRNTVLRNLGTKQ